MSLVWAAPSQTARTGVSTPVSPAYSASPSVMVWSTPALTTRRMNSGRLGTSAATADTMAARRAPMSARVGPAAGGAASDAAEDGRDQACPALCVSFQTPGADEPF